MEKMDAQALFALAEIKILNMFEMVNPYWPRHPDYYKTIINSPWWLAQTKFGMIMIGWRKRVICINWENTNVHKEITADDVTKNDVMVHAWNKEKALEYLISLRKELEALPSPQ